MLVTLHGGCRVDWALPTHGLFCLSGKGSPINSLFLAPGVTPWKTTLPGVHNGANNPGIRVFDYERDTLQVKVGNTSHIL